MGDTSIIIAFLIGLGMFLFIMSFAIMQYDRATKRSAFSKNLKTYSALFGYKDPNEVAIKMGIKIEDYYKNCQVLRITPKPKKIIMYTIYGICCFCISFILAILWNPIVLLAGVMLFVVFAVTEQDTIKSRANDMRTQIQDDLPRFLDLLKTELSIGLAVENAIYILCSKYDCLLSKEFLEALNKSEMGLDGWQKALEDISEKYDVESLSNFVMDITTSYRKGVNVATSVTREAEEVKKKYILDIKERAGKVTNLILIPIAIFQFIPLIAFLMFPAITSVFNGF
jgi:Flp pilus assembly protein TadB